MPDVDDNNDAYTDTGSSVEINGLGTVETEYETTTHEERSDTSEEQVEHIDTTSEVQDNTMTTNEQDETQIP